MNSLLTGIENCSRNNSAICNGPLMPDRAYEVAYRANNGEGRISRPTNFGADFRTDRVMELIPGK